MAELILTPDPVTAVVSVEAVSVETRPQFESAAGGLFPLQAKTFDIDEYRLKAGWPVAVPPLDVHQYTEVNVEGTVLSTREEPDDIVTGADMRWVAKEEYYDLDSLRWLPAYTRDQQATWNTSVEYAPTLVDRYDYRIGDERFYRSALNFDSDTRNHMWTEYVRGDNMTILMVMSPNSLYGNNAAVPFNGLIAPGGPTPAGDTFPEDKGDTWVSVNTRGGGFWLATDNTPEQLAIAFSSEANRTAPSYVALVLSRPMAHVYIGSGPNSIRSASVPTGDRKTSITSLAGMVLGRANGSVTTTADMALFDLGVYNHALTKDEVVTEFALLSQSYGGTA